MAVETSLPTLLSTLTQSLVSASDAAPEATSFLPPKDGISLLDVKNELLLSYLQNLVFLILLKLRERRNGSHESQDVKIDDAVVKKLVELRVYLERGVRPLEGRLKYQIDKVIRAADDFSRSSATAASQKQPAAKKAANTDADSGSEVSDDNDSEAESTNGVPLNTSEIDDLQYRPQPGSLVRPANAAPEVSSAAAANDGIYRPPRITATAMPKTQLRTKEERKPYKSATLDEFISTELSTAPLAEPSIGSTIAYGGRRAKSARERQEEQERLEYEERNYVRLPKASKKERAAKKKANRRDEPGYGGEEWRELGEGIDRIERLTRRKGGDLGARSVLERSRKRAATEGERHGGGAEVGQGFAKRVKTLDGGRRDRGRR